MSPINIVEILAAAAPIVASIANKSENTTERNRSPVNNIHITVNNNFYTSPDTESINTANQLQAKLIESAISSGERYML